MSNRTLLPFGREIRFISLVTLVILAGFLLGAAVLLLMFNRELADLGFADAFFTLRELYRGLNVYSMLAVGLQFALTTAIVYLAALRYSHKISGPMYRIRMILNDFQEGKAVSHVTFRDGDFLKPLEGLLTRKFQRTSEQDAVVAELESLIAELAGVPMPDDATRARLKALADRLEGGHG